LRATFAALIVMIASSSGMEAPRQGSSASRSIAFRGGRVLVERQGTVDHLTISDSKGDVISESWCPLETGSYDELSVFFRNFGRAVDAGNVDTITSLVRYPLQVNGTLRITISDRQSLVRRYAEIFTASVVMKIRDAAPEVVFCRNGQAMIGDGVIWAHAEKGKVGVDVVNR